MRYFLILIITMLLLLSGCDNNTPVAITDKAIYSEFSITYDRTANKTKADAEFWEDGKNGAKKFFNPDAQLTYQDNLLEYRSEGVYYTKELTGYFITSTFKVVDINKKQFINSTSVNKVEFYFNVPDTIIDLSTSFTMTWDGKPLETGEYVVFRIGGENFQQKAIGSTSVVVSSTNLAALSGYRNQSISATIDRYKSVPLDKDLGAGGWMFVKYTGLQKNFYIR